MRRRLLMILLYVLAFYAGKRFAEFEHRPIQAYGFTVEMPWTDTALTADPKPDPKLKDLGPTTDEPAPANLPKDPTTPIVPFEGGAVCGAFTGTIGICQQET